MGASAAGEAPGASPVGPAPPPSSLLAHRGAAETRRHAAATPTGLGGLASAGAAGCARGLVLGAASVRGDVTSSCSRNAAVEAALLFAAASALASAMMSSIQHAELGSSDGTRASGGNAGARASSHECTGRHASRASLAP